MCCNNMNNFNFGNNNCNNGFNNNGMFGGANSYYVSGKINVYPYNKCWCNTNYYNCKVPYFMLPYYQYAVYGNGYGVQNPCWGNYIGCGGN